MCLVELLAWTSTTLRDGLRQEEDEGLDTVSTSARILVIPTRSVSEDGPRLRFGLVSFVPARVIVEVQRSGSHRDEYNGTIQYPARDSHHERNDCLGASRRSGTTAAVQV